MKKMIRKAAVATAMALLLTGSALISRAQSNNAMISGEVDDKTGAVIPGATITLTDEASGVTRSTKTDEAGQFSLVGVPVGTYDMKASAAGFNSMMRKGIVIHIADQMEMIGIALSVSGGSEDVVVTAAADEMTPTTSGEVSYTVSDTQLHNMDIEGRSAIELLGLIPGSGNTGNFNGTYNGASAGFTQNSSSFTVNGNRFDQVAVVSDGASVSDLNTAGSAAVTPNVDMIAELKVESAAYSVTEPNGPIVVAVQTKSGGRNFHGLAELTARSHSLNASDWQQKSEALPAPQTSLYYPALQIGGPAAIPGTGKLKDKLFFFAATELAQQQVDLSPRKTQVPTAAMRTGDFTNSTYLGYLSNSSNNYLGWEVANQPCSGQFSGSGFWSQNCQNAVYGSNWGQIQKGAIDPAGQILLNALPLPNVDPSTHGGYNLISDFTVSEPRNQEILKLDYAQSDSNHFSFRYNHENESVPQPYGPWNVWNMTPYPAAQTQKNASNSFNLNMTKVLTPRLTNEASLSYTRFTMKTNITGLNAVSMTALSYPYADLYKSTSGLIPNVSFEQQAGGLYIAGGEAPPYLGAQNSYTFNDGLTYLFGKHLVQAGFYAQYARYNLLTTGNDNGSVDTENYATVTNNDWADLLMGYTSYYSQSSGNIKADMALKRFDFYAQDTWKIFPRLTLNYGLRVNHLGWWYDRGGKIAIFNPSAWSSSAAISAYSGMQTHATNSATPYSGSTPLSFQYAPGVGFAYDVTGNGKTVVRGGFSANFYSDPGNNAFSGVMAPPNFLVTSAWTTGYATAGVYNTSSDFALSSLSTPSTFNTYGTTPVPTVWGTANPGDHLAPVTYSWNAAISHLFWGANKVEANYVGNSSHNLVGYGIRNAVPEGAENGTYYGGWYDNYSGLRKYWQYGDINTHYHNLNSNYNALQLNVSRQKGWLNYWGSYTFGKTLAYNAEDAFDMKRWYGPAPFDRSQIGSLSYFIKLPAFGEKYLGNHKVVNQAVDGWQVSGIFQAMTGGPIGNNFGSEYAANKNTIGIYGPGNYSDFADGTPDEAAVPVMVCDPRKGLKSGQYFNPACFQGPTRLKNGTYRLPYIHGPAYINDSLGLFKTFTIKDAKKLEIRGEAFNLFNHAWNEFIASDPRMYMGFNSDGSDEYKNGIDVNTVAGTVNNKTGHREISLAAKFYF
jgi:hypothetical protein